MKYRDLGTTLSFENPDRSCTILATYTANKRDQSKYDLEIKLHKVMKINGRDCVFEHFVGKEPITATYLTIKNYAARIVEYGVESGSFNKHFKNFAAKIENELN